MTSTPLCPATPATPAALPPLGMALLTAALCLPLAPLAQAESQPERGSITLKYLDYKDSQPGWNRIWVHAPSVAVLAPVGENWSVAGSLVSDVLSGASPAYHAEPNPFKIHEHRKAGDFTVTRYLPRGTFALGASYSTESDYVSRGITAQGSFASEDKNTTFSGGLGLTSDQINPNNKVVVNERKNITDLMVGVTQVLSPNDIAQLNLTYVHGTGYYSDPYKLLDNRPRNRNQTAMLLRWNHHLDSTDGTTRLSYRYYTDTYHVKAHTLTAEYVQPLASGWTLTPLLRFHTQGAASFYVEADGSGYPVLPPDYAPGRIVSEDQRLSAFGAFTYGLKVAKQLDKDWSMDVKVEQYQQNGSWRVFGTGSKNMLPFDARMIQLGVSRLF